MKRWLSLVVVLSLFLGTALFIQTATAQANTRVRVVQAVADSAPLDIFINGVLVAEALDFTQASPHFTIPAGATQVDIQVADQSIFSGSFDLEQDFAFSIILYGSAANIQSRLLEDILDPMAPGSARMTAVHLVNGVDSLDIARADGAPLMTPLLFGEPYGTINIPAGSYDLIGVTTGSTQALATLGQLDLQTNVLYTVLLAGNAGDVQTVVLTSPVNTQAGEAWTRLVHGVADAPAVDVYLNDVLAFPNLSFGSATPHVSLPIGEHSLVLRQTGLPPNSDPLFSDTLSVNEGAQTVAIRSNDGILELASLADAIDGIISEQARVQALNFGDEAATLGLNQRGEFAPGGLEPLAASQSFDLAPGEINIGGGAEISEVLYGGTLYTVILLEGGEAVWGATAIAVQPESVPFEQREIATVAAAEPTAVPTSVAVEPTSVPTEVAQVTTQAPPVVEVAATPTLIPTQPAPVSPVAQPNAVPTRPGIYPPVDVIFGVVTLNQGVNLQCREYPSPDARSIGLVPNGTQLTIVGLYAPRDTTGDFGGRSDAILIENIPDLTPLSLEDFEVADFPPDFLQALDVENFWLNVDWILPDGTPFACWVNARYVLVTYEGKRVEDAGTYLQMVKNRNIDLIPYNVPGGPRDPDDVVSPQQVSAPTPRAADSNIIATVNVNSGVNLQLRRTPGVTGESLSLVPGGAQLRVIGKTSIPVSGVTGEPEIPEWLYIEYQQPDGVVVRGWISAQYVIVTLGGRLVNLADIPPADASAPGGFVNSVGEVVPENTGASAPAAAAPAASTPQIEGTLLIDPGASLNLRDLPNDGALVRASIPSGTVVNVIGRNGAGTWLNVVFASPTGDVAGWVSSNFVQVVFQGQAYPVQNLPITTGEPDTFNANPTATPSG